MRINPRVAAGRSLTRPRSKGKSGQPGKKILLTLLLILLTAAWGVDAPPANAEEAPPAKSAFEEGIVSGPVNFDRAVRLALTRSPYFTKSSLEIEIKRLDEKDSRYDLIPPINFRTQYYVNQPGGTSNQPYSLSFTYTNYNPVEAYFTLQAKKYITQISILAHMEVIAQGLQKLGRMFLEMETLKQAADRQDYLIELSQKKLDYYQNRSRIGAATSLEVRVAAQELEGAKVEKERIAYSQKRLLDRAAMFMGLKPQQPLELDCKDARRQVIGGFNPATATLEQAKDHSFELKAVELKKELQRYNIMLAKAKLLPYIFAGATTPDPLNALQSRDMFVYFGLEIPVWDGFKRLRNISRQKTILRQFDIDADMKNSDLANKWFDAQENLRTADVALKTAQTQEELANLKERQGEIRYKTGGEPLSVHLEARKAMIEAQKNTSLKTLDYDLALLGLRYLSGDLSGSYVDARSWQQ
jgi:outer membrane protein TolC